MFYFICESIYNNTNIRYNTTYSKLDIIPHTNFMVIAYFLQQHHITKIFFVYKQINDRVTPQRLPYYFWGY